MRNVAIILITLFCFGCNSINRPKEPDNLISQNDMANILYDVYILNAAKGANKSVLEENGIYPEDYIFKKYGIDSLQFALSNEYYGFYIDEYAAIVDRVEDRIYKDKEYFKDIAKKEELEKQRKRDSVRALSDSLSVKVLKVPKQQEKREDYKEDSDESN
ncbi:MAG: DUF4296 domain-containing protein [Psychroserpens sp.]|uniref:DUF4296 domain-containing protein n=1 Tax=Psychroserpens sp. TaxID=2020870 RepID=UPI003C7161F5